jgi:hypothetical protein
MGQISNLYSQKMSVMGQISNLYPQKMSVMGPYYICRVYVVYPDEFHNGLWGGEGVVKGMLKRQAKRKRKKYCTAAESPVALF